GIAIELRLRQEAPDTGEEAAPQPEEPFGLLCHLGGGQGGGYAEPDAKRRRQGAGAQAALLPAAIDLRLAARPRPAPDVERANTFRPVDLMAGYRHEVDAHGIDVERELAEGLRCVGVEEDAPRAAERTDLGKRLDHADLVMRRHHRDQRGLVLDRGL